MMQSKLIIFFLLIGITINAKSQGLSLNDCRAQALEHNRKIKTANEHQLTLGSLRKYAKTKHLPNFSINGGYMRMNKEIRLLNDDVFLPIVPAESIINGNFNQLVFLTNTQLLEETFVLNP
ncbi:MAG: hypothetical protein ACLFVR_07650, partial [Thiohalospira sp.]